MGLSENWDPQNPVVYHGLSQFPCKNVDTYGKSPFLMGKSTVNAGGFISHFHTRPRVPGWYLLVPVDAPRGSWNWQQPTWTSFARSRDVNDG